PRRHEIEVETRLGRPSPRGMPACIKKWFARRLLRIAGFAHHRKTGLNLRRHGGRGTGEEKTVRLFLNLKRIDLPRANVPILFRRATLAGGRRPLLWRLHRRSPGKGQGEGIERSRRFLEFLPVLGKAHDELPVGSILYPYF